MIQSATFQIASAPSPHVPCTSFILSTGLHTPLHGQSNEAMQKFPASAFHSQSTIKRKSFKLEPFFFFGKISTRLLGNFTGRCAAAHSSLVDVFDFQANQPRTQRDILVRIFMKYRPKRISLNYFKF